MLPRCARLLALTTLLAALLTAVGCGSGDDGPEPWVDPCADGSCITGPDFYVRAGASGDGSKGNPLGSIRAAVNRAQDGARVHVAAGRYEEIVRVENKTIALIGGYPDDFSAADPKSNVTHIAGDGSDSTVTLLTAGSTIVEGFTVSGGVASTDKSGVGRGGGFYIFGDQPTLRNNIIESNDNRDGNSDAIGGGIYAEGSRAKIIDNVVRDNHSGQGAGIAIIEGAAEIRGNTVANNISHSDHGGGIYASGEVTIRDNTVTGNEVGRGVGYGWGGGIYVFNRGTRATLSGNVVRGNYAITIGSGEFVDDGADATITNDLIVDNRCPAEGGAGIYVDGDGGTASNATFVNVTVAGHKCGSGTGGSVLVADQGSTVTFRNSIFWNNGGDSEIAAVGGSTVRATYTNAQKRLSGSGNTSVDPRFVGGSDYHLKAGSPCIDAGDPADDASAEPAPNGGRVNLGAYGGTSDATKS